MADSSMKQESDQTRVNNQRKSLNMSSSFLKSMCDLVPENGVKIEGSQNASPETVEEVKRHKPEGIPGLEDLQITLMDQYSSDSGLVRLHEDPDVVAPCQPMEHCVLKMTTFMDDGAKCSFRVTKEGATVGRSSENDISIPGDITMAPVNHAKVLYEGGAFYLQNLDETSGTFVRLRTQKQATSSYHWPMMNGCRFRVGHAEFAVAIDKNDPEVLNLRAVCGKLSGNSYRVDKTGTTIGRSTENSIHAGDGELSRRHAEIIYKEKDKMFYLLDVGSTNGTFMKLHGPYSRYYRLAYGDFVLLSKTCLSVDRFEVGVFSDMGVRKSMEDTHAIVHDLHIDNMSAQGLGPQSYFAVYDGHGGDAASEYLCKNLHKLLEKQLKADSLQLDSLSSIEKIDSIITQSIVSTFKKADEQFLENSDFPQAGSTAAVALIVGKRLYISNLGDSRTITCRSGQGVALSQDHKPNRADETERIRKAGGFIIHGRIMGELAVSRAFGDIDFKMFDSLVRSTSDDETETISSALSEPLVSCVPDIKIEEVLAEDEFLVIACDGLYDVLTDQEIVDFIREQMSIVDDIQHVTETLVDHAIQDLNSRDNVTALVVLLRDPSEWTPLKSSLSESALEGRESHSSLDKASDE